MSESQVSSYWPTNRKTGSSEILILTKPAEFLPYSTQMSLFTDLLFRLKQEQMVYYPQNAPYSFVFFIKTMTLSKSPASDPKPVNKSGRKRFPLLPVQFQCKLVTHVQDSLFSSLKNQRLVIAVKQAAPLL